MTTTFRGIPCELTLATLDHDRGYHLIARVGQGVTTASTPRLPSLRDAHHLLRLAYATDEQRCHQRPWCETMAPVLDAWVSQRSMQDLADALATDWPTVDALRSEPAPPDGPGIMAHVRMLAAKLDLDVTGLARVVRWWVQVNRAIRRLPTVRATYRGQPCSVEAAFHEVSGLHEVVATVSGFVQRIPLARAPRLDDAAEALRRAHERYEHANAVITPPSGPPPRRSASLDITPSTARPPQRDRTRRVDAPEGQ